MILYATPKINLGLNVLRRRPDGFHDLHTVFYPVHSMWDILTIELSDSFRIEVPGAGWDPQTDLCAKAYRLLADEFPQVGPVSICLDKGIPVGAGLGGGSSDAAQTLMALNCLFDLRLTNAELAARAAKLGSDCAFFVYDTPMFAEGRGEVLSPVSLDLDDYEIEIEMPEGVHVSTAEAYGGIVPCERRDTPLRDALSLPVEQWRDNVVNDFEPTVFAAHPQIRDLKESMYRNGAVYAAMSGSGSAVFGLYK